MYSFQGTVVGVAKKMRLVDYIFERVLTRTVPDPVSTRRPSILMKIDIEGSELEVLTDLIVSGALQVEKIRQSQRLRNRMHFEVSSWQGDQMSL
jgi:hypothetical protein